MKQDVMLLMMPGYHQKVYDSRTNLSVHGCKWLASPFCLPKFTKNPAQFLTMKEKIRNSMMNN